MNAEDNERLAKLERKERPTPPKIVKVEGVALFGAYIGCPACETQVVRSFAYCPSCGQHLEW